ncbi:hypothetical protein C0J52_05811 [Blattella germanica]|nr:hypothetical protein C0J52_05811 [Blattella germanica]
MVPHKLAAGMCQPNQRKLMTQCNTEGRETLFYNKFLDTRKLQCPSDEATSNLCTLLHLWYLFIS